MEPLIKVQCLKHVYPDKYFNKIRKEIGVVFQNIDEQIIGPRVWDDIALLQEMMA